MGQGGGGEFEAFWAFTLSLYGRAGVPEACLALQDRDGLDVNLALWCLWTGATGRALAASQIDSAKAACRPWRDGVLEPLRALRRHMKAGIASVDKALSDPLREQVKKSELAAERVQHAILAGLLTAAPTVGSRALAERNLALYASAPAESKTLLDAAFQR
jgi:uncharacterized protein (TIGR02444 family)